MSRSTSRLNAIAAVRAAAMHSTISASLRSVNSAYREANTTAASANGSAKTVWLSLTSEP